MKLPMPTVDEIYKAAYRAESAIYESGSRTADVYIIENAIRSMLQTIVDRMDIQIAQPIGLDLSKA